MRESSILSTSSFINTRLDQDASIERSDNFLRSQLIEQKENIERELPKMVESRALGVGAKRIE